MASNITNTTLKITRSAVIVSMLLSTLISACGTPKSSADPELSSTTQLETAVQEETLTPFQPDPVTPTPTATAVPQAILWVSEALPKDLKDHLVFPAEVVFTAQEEDANLVFGPLAEGITGNTSASTQWIYALVAPFGTVADGISLEDLKLAWQGEEAGPFPGASILMDPETLAVMTHLLGEPAEDAVEEMDAGALLDQAWERGNSWAIVPFEDLQPRWKVLKIDGKTPLSKKFDPLAYALTVSFGFAGSAESLDLYNELAARSAESVIIPATNRDPELLSEVVVTGVTALVRAIAARMRTEGNLYPAKDIGSILMEADITHISNEVAFAEDCPTPDPNSASLKFCSNPDYIELLTYVGTDVIELSGNHVNDWGWENLAYTLGIYRDKGIQYYAGGDNTEDSRKAVYFEDHGNRIAFIGCNPAGPKNAWATDTQAGSASCEGDWLPAAVTQLKAEGWLPVVTLQFAESYNPTPLYPQQDMFRSLADAGAVIVSGSQAHLPQGYGFWGESLIHYGLGNLFFDQMYYDGLREDLVGGTRWEMIDQHYFYNGRYLGENIITAELEDFAKPRLMTEEERSALLEKMFAASDWNTEKEGNE